MLERSKSKRAFLPKGKQQKFIIEAKEKLGLSWKELAKILDISTRNLLDWKNEKFSMPFNSLKIICQKAKIKRPKNIKIKSAFWYVSKGAKIGGVNTYKKYGIVGGNPSYRKKKWKEWWENKGRFARNPILQQLPIKKPKKSTELAEFTGIVLGDGGLSENQLTITLNYKDDEKYIVFVIKLIKNLFDLSPTVHRETKNSVDNIVVSRKKLVEFLTREIGLKKGNKIKNQIDIPLWIKNNKNFRIACIRGLVDTDGSIFTHSYMSNKKVYHYKKMAFTSRSKPLALSVYNILKNLKLNPRIARKERDVWLDSIKNVRRYFKIIGSHNPKHLKRYRN